MTEDTTQPSAGQGLVTAGDSFSSSHHDQSSTHLHPTAQESTSDNDTSERPVREKLKKTSIQSMPRNDKALIPSDFTVEHNQAMDSEGPQKRESPLNRTPSPPLESRGRLSRKRSYDDSVEKVAAAGDVSTDKRNQEDDARHTRKRSRDVRAAQPQDTKFTTTPIEQSLPEAEGDCDRTHGNELPDREMQDSIRSPGKKRSGEDLDTDLHRGQKIAATDEAKAHRRSEDSERGQEPHEDDNNAPPVDKTVAQDQQVRGKEESTSEQIKSFEAFADPSQTDAQVPTSKGSSQGVGADKRDSEKAPSGFAASGFAAMSGSSTSPFGNLGASTSSVFKSSPTPTPNAAGPASHTTNGFNFGQGIPPNTDSKSPSPFVSAAAAPTASPFAANGATPKLTSFGASPFGSGFANPTTGATRLTSFAAPTGDLAPPKPAETTKAFGAQADPSREEEDDGGSEDETGLEEVGAGNHEVDSRFQQQEGKAILFNLKTDQG